MKGGKIVKKDNGIKNIVLGTFIIGEQTDGTLSGNQDTFGTLLGTITQFKFGNIINNFYIYII